jgi:hypothetical protein
MPLVVTALRSLRESLLLPGRRRAQQRQRRDGEDPSHEL